jgi:putative ABC transport system substrate-binding protein
MLVFGACAGPYPAFEQALRALGYVGRQNVVIECRTAGGDYGRLPQAASELVQLKVDVIAALNHPAARAAQQATSAIPIVMVAIGDLVASGLIASLGRPGGNITGVSYYATELTAKRLQLLQDLIPGMRRIGVLANPAAAYLPFVRDTEQAA